jgi:mono/diheme cytochrome c family protein
MRAAVRVVDRAEYEKFLAAASAGGPKDENSGAAVFEAAGCSGCHAFAPAKSDAEVGPSLDAVDPGGRPLDEFLRESIEDPSAVVAEGYQDGVMPNTFGESLSEEQLDALVQYLVDGQKGSK